MPKGIQSIGSSGYRAEHRRGVFKTFRKPEPPKRFDESFGYGGNFGAIGEMALEFFEGCFEAGSKRFGLIIRGNDRGDMRLSLVPLIVLPTKFQETDERYSSEGRPYAVTKREGPARFFGDRRQDTMFPITMAFDRQPNGNYNFGLFK